MTNSKLTDAALIGLVLGAAARQIPALAEARVSHPGIYDAALAAAVAALASPKEDDAILLPGQSPGVALPPPGWNLI